MQKVRDTIINVSFIYKVLFFVILTTTFFGCTKKLYISSTGKPAIINKERNRNPNFLFKSIVKNYFAKWNSKSKPINASERLKLDSLSLMGYAIYEAFVSKELSHINNNSEYFLVPDKIRVSLFKCDNIDSCIATADIEICKNRIRAIVIKNFRPYIKNKKCLFYTKKYKKKFPNFSLRYGINPYLEIDSPLMSGGYRFLESSPFVYQINIYDGSDFISIEYSSGTSDIESVFKYKNGRLELIKILYELAVD